MHIPLLMMEEFLSAGCTFGQDVYISAIVLPYFTLLLSSDERFLLRFFRHILHVSTTFDLSFSIAGCLFLI